MSLVQISLAKDCNAPAVHLWEILLDPGLWWGEGVLLEAAPGGAFHELWQDARGQHHTHGRVVLVEAPERLALKWWDDDWSFETDVMIRISALERRSRISLVHTGWQSAPEAQRQSQIEAHRQGWDHHLTNLVACAAQQT